MILEGLVTTRDANGLPHLAPMGPTVDANWSHVLLRPFPTSQTFQNLKRDRFGVLHVTDDVRLLAMAAVGRAPTQEYEPAQMGPGFVLTSTCRYYELAIRDIDESGQRMMVHADIVFTGRRRDFFGLNRAKHAVVEAAIMATRLHLIPPAEVQADLTRLRVLVEKTGGDAEHEAFQFLENYVAEKQAELRP